MCVCERKREREREGSPQANYFKLFLLQIRTKNIASASVALESPVGVWHENCQKNNCCATGRAGQEHHLFDVTSMSCQMKMAKISNPPHNLPSTSILYIHILYPPWFPPLSPECDIDHTLVILISIFAKILTRFWTSSSSFTYSRCRRCLLLRRQGWGNAEGRTSDTTMATSNVLLVTILLGYVRQLISQGTFPLYYVISKSWFVSKTAGFSRSQRFLYAVHYFRPSLDGRFRSKIEIRKNELWSKS